MPSAHPGRLIAIAVGCAVVVLGAVLVEMVAGAAAVSVEPSWEQRVVPLAWPQPWRVVWWLAIAGAAATHRLLLDRVDGRQRRWLIALHAAPFVVFAGGVAVGAQWATFH